MQNLFEQAVRQQVRFGINGEITIEQLYNTKRSKAFKEALISYEEALQNQLEAFGKSSRRNSVQKSVAQKETELKLNVISSLLDEIENEEKEKAEEATKAEKRQQLLALKATKEAEAMQQLTFEQIDALLNQL